jgi:branched-chain amino acid transport system ATP-binding protein
MNVAAGERHALIGPNGAGKTTLFNLISGRFPLTSGEIRLDAARLDELPPHRINRLGLSRSFQITSIFHQLSVFENIRCSLLWSRGYRYSFWHALGRQRALNEETERLLEHLNLAERRGVQAGLLSYAEQRALEIGMTIAGGASMILLDEPTAGMRSAKAKSLACSAATASVGRPLARRSWVSSGRSARCATAAGTSPGCAPIWWRRPVSATCRRTVRCSRR